MKASVLLGAGWEDDSLEMLWRDADRAFCRLRRDVADDGRHAFIPIHSGADHPTLESLNRLTHEYELRAYLDRTWALQPVELVRERGQIMLVVDYAGGEPLDRLTRQPMEIGQFLRLAAALSGALSQLHGRGLIHKDIKPANVLVDSATGRVHLTGFGIASRLPRERQAPAPPEVLAGTLAYMAPEQTGRVNRSIDSRSDLYSLGVTFYEMLTGSLPFTASDPMEWVHCHIARQPAAPSERLRTVPVPVSAITMKLLSKTAEERYQTAAGVESDLRAAFHNGKVRQLELLYPQIGAEESIADATATIQTPVEHLDLATVIKVSEAVSGEIVFERLIDALMRAAIEHAGAERGLLILPRADDYQIEAAATTSTDDVNVVVRQASSTAADLPISILQYVLRTRESVLLHDASGQNPFAADEYIRGHSARSVLCLPLLKQTRLLGLLYLENSLTPHAFTPARMAVLKLLASEAATSLENTRLWSEQKQAEAEIRTLKDQLYRENLALRDEVDRALMFEEIVGASNSLKTALSRIAKVAPTDSTVFITGETGTGKELIARAVHKRSQRSGRAFVSVNCAALAPALISSELFGHEKGAFTGATQRRLGRFEQAHGGTIFLDEVGELPPDTQLALLRVLQEREFERVGGAQTIKIDVRVITATNRDLPAAVANGSFRQDLFYRLNVFPIEVPALRERADDILMLVEYFVHRHASRAGKHFTSIDKKTLDLLQTYDWPGNIRELQNVIERSVILNSGDVFAVDESWLSKQPARRRPQVASPAPPQSEARSEREIIEAALAASRGRVAGRSGAAARLGVPSSTLAHRIQVLRINKTQFKFR